MEGLHATQKKREAIWFSDTGKMKRKRVNCLLQKRRIKQYFKIFRVFRQGSYTANERGICQFKLVEWKMLELWK